MEQRLTFKVKTTPTTRQMFWGLAVGCFLIVNFGWLFVLGPYPAVGLIVMGIALVASVSFRGAAYEITDSTITFRTDLWHHWTEDVPFITRIVPETGRSPFGEVVQGFRIFTWRGRRFVAPEDPETFLARMRELRPDLRPWGYELRSPELSLLPSS